MSNYYVNTPSGNDGNSGLTELLPWLTVNKVNTSSFNAGDSVLFNKTCTWREQLTVPSSGTNGSPITFGAYGTGADPIISGADLVATWTVVPGGETGGLFVADAEDGGVVKWTGVTTGGTSTFVASTAQKANGSYSYLATTDGTNPAYGYETITAQGDIYARFYFYLPTSYNQGTWVLKHIFELLSGTTARIHGSFSTSGDAGAVAFVAQILTSPWPSFTSATLARDTWHWVEFHFLVDASVGGFQAWLDGASMGSNFTLNTSGQTISTIRAGIIDVSTANNAVYFDDIKADTTGPIGAYSAGTSYLYSASAAWATYVVQEDGVNLTKAASLAAVTSAGKWYSDGTTCYVWATDNADPDTHTMELGKRTYCVYAATARPYLIIDHLQTIGANDGGICLLTASDYCTISNCTVKSIGRADWGSGIRLSSCNHATITLNDISYIANGGIVLEDWGGAAFDDITVSHNHIYYTGGGGIGAGPHIVGQGTNVIQEYNKVHHFAQLIDDLSGVGTWQTGAGCIVRYNLVYSGGTASFRGSGINLDSNSSPAECYGNVVYGNNYGGINVTESGHKVYNNTCYHNNEGSADAGELSLFTQTHAASSCLIKNNILVASTGKHLLVAGTGNTTGHTIDYNEWYGGSATPFTWGATDYNFTDYKTASSQDAHSLNSDPLFTNAAGGDFTLAAGSPCIDAGVDLGTDYQMALAPGSTWP